VRVNSTTEKKRRRGHKSPTQKNCHVGRSDLPKDAEQCGRKLGRRGHKKGSKPSEKRKDCRVGNNRLVGVGKNRAKETNFPFQKLKKAFRGTRSGKGGRGLRSGSKIKGGKGTTAGPRTWFHF